jgi:hypothetical protein
MAESVALLGRSGRLSTFADADAATALALQRTVGNRATVKALAPVVRQVARCAGACSCGGGCRDEDDTGVRGSNAAKDHAAEIDFVFGLIMASLPATLVRLSPLPFPFDGPLATVRLSVEDAIGPDAEPDLHVDISYGNAPLNAAGQLAGGTGRNGNGSDIFGDDDRGHGRIRDHRRYLD